MPDVCPVSGYRDLKIHRNDTTKTQQIKGGFAVAMAAGLAAARSPAAKNVDTSAYATIVAGEATQVAVSDVSFKSDGKPDKC